ncbi:hypothetical protein ABW19_dt0200810 [Dactylella cylindrospora]|nr:hypothetical protein ABW19_dt0200810 [Dactylella cylindrospora]
MAMEQLEIHSRSYLIRYVNVPAGHVISWSIQPHKKSINFGLFKHVKIAGGATPQIGSSIVGLSAPNPQALPAVGDDAASDQRPRTQRSNSTEAETIQKLEASGLRQVHWYGKIEAEKVTTGKFEVPPNQGGAWALVFDNTFSKQTGKTATLVLLTYPANNPAPASHHLHHFDSPAGSTVSLPQAGGSSLVASTLVNASTDSVPESNGNTLSSSSGFYTGVLKKRKRKRHQGFARRFFSLDFTSSTLSYYLSRESSSLRGAIPLGLAELSANEKNFEITVDSGAEVWQLRAASLSEWEGWKDALNRASEKAQKRTQTGMGGDKGSSLGRETDTPNLAAYHSAEEQGWAAVESLMGRISGIRDATRRLTNWSSAQRNSIEGGLGISTAVVGGAGQPGADEKRPFWKRKASGSSTPSSSSPSLAVTGREKRGKSLSAGVGISAAQAMMAATPVPPLPTQTQTADITPHLNALLSDLDAFVADITHIVQEAKHRRYLHQKQSDANGIIGLAEPRKSLDSIDSQEFFDATDGDAGQTNEGRIVIVDNDSEEGHSETYATDDDASSDSENDQSFSANNFGAFAPKAQDLSPLPLEKTKRRTTVKGTTILPPSLIAFFRKNVGKDLSTIAMPVSANEPLSALQKIAEQLEYSELLDYAADASEATGERLLYIAAFAISNFSNTRAKERAIRKPFNPLLGETYELVREDKGYRFLAEKVSHRPLVMAAQADSANWTFTQSPMPSQKFWGKSAEINTSGRVRITLHKTGDNFSWTPATTFLRNIIAGEKYIEPVGTMTIHHENTGDKAQITFKVKGMFSGRSEDVSVQVHDKDGKVKPYSLHGKWTGSLVIFDDHDSMVKQLWQVGDLVPDAAKKYGFTEFAAQLNEITSIEEDKMAGTDTRLRPDQRLCEEGQLDEAETVKLELEEKQRQRRRQADEEGRPHQPKWFVKVRETADEEVWGMKTGKDGYWGRRKKGEWPADMLELYK